MEAVLSPELIGADDYLEGEKVAEVRHEFVAGQVFAMAGASEEHNLIAGNVFAALHDHLRGKVCRVFTLDMKVRLYISAAHLFYYPDVLVACEPRDSNRYFKRFPKVLVEVLSPETDRTDRREKSVGYTQTKSNWSRLKSSASSRPRVPQRQGAASETQTISWSFRA